MKAVESTGCPPLLVSWGASMLIQALNRPTCLASPYQQPMELVAASDASADPESKTAAVGGCFFFGLSPNQLQAHCSSDLSAKTSINGPLRMEIHRRESLPWDFMVTFFFCFWSYSSHRTATNYIPVPILTDNQSNALTMLANRSKKWPSAAVLMELSLQLHVHQTCLAPAFIH